MDANVELAHDVLLTAWPRLRSWLAADEADRIAYGQIVQDAGEWDRRGRDPAFLYRGSRLEDARRPRGGEPILSAGASAAARTRRRWQAAAGLLAGLLVVAVITAVVAVRFGRDADQQRAVAVSRIAQILSRQAAAYSQAVPDDHATSARLAVAARSISPADEALASMTAVLSRPQRAILTGNTSTVHAVAFSPDGTRLASGSNDLGAAVEYPYRRPYRPAADGRPAIAAYVRADQDAYHLHTLQLFTITAADVSRTTVFRDQEVFDAFSLEPRIAAAR
jgi:hypothetical protein